MQETILKNGRQYRSHPVYNLQYTSSSIIFIDCAHVQSLLPRGQLPNPLRERNSAVNRIMEEHVKGKINQLAHVFCDNLVSLSTWVCVKNYFLRISLSAYVLPKFVQNLHSSLQCCGSGMFIPDPNFFHISTEKGL